MRHRVQGRCERKGDCTAWFHRRHRRANTVRWASPGQIWKPVWHCSWRGRFILLQRVWLWGGLQADALSFVFSLGGVATRPAGARRAAPLVNEVKVEWGAAQKTFRDLVAQS